MKKFMKGCAITALVFGALGFILGMAGSAMAGRASIAEAVRNATGGRVHMNPAAWWKWGFDMDEWIHAEAGEVSYGMEEDIVRDEGIVQYETVKDNDPMFNGRYDIWKGNMEKYCPGEGILKLDIEVGGVLFDTEVSEDGQIYLETENVHRFQGYVEDNTLYIRAKGVSTENWTDIGSSAIRLYLPAEYQFTEADVEVGAGNLYFTDLYAEEVSLEAGAGHIEIQGANAEKADISVGAGSVWLQSFRTAELDVEIGLGEFSMEGAVGRKADIECAMGNVDMTLAGKEQDFNYQMECSMGNIDLGNNSYVGFGQEKEVDHQASKDMDIECSMGNIIIRFLD